jgi:hypothetical protein
MQRWDDAERHFRRALEHDELMGNRPFVVYAGLAWSAMLLDRDAADDRERAAEMVSRVLPMAREMRMTSMVARAESLQASVSVSASSR